jgi:hypothetical protein
MERKSHYGTVTEALAKFREQGYSLDFNLEKDRLISGMDAWHMDDFDIVDVYRYEGESDPGDSAAVYAIRSKDGHKGVLVTGYGISSEGISSDLLKKLDDDSGEQ